MLRMHWMGQGSTPSGLILPACNYSITTTSLFLARYLALTNPPSEVPSVTCSWVARSRNQVEVPTGKLASLLVPSTKLVAPMAFSRNKASCPQVQLPTKSPTLCPADKAVPSQVKVYALDLEMVSRSAWKSMISANGMLFS